MESCPTNKFPLLAKECKKKGLGLKKQQHTSPVFQFKLEALLYWEENVAWNKMKERQ